MNAIKVKIEGTKYASIVSIKELEDCIQHMIRGEFSEAEIADLPYDIVKKGYDEMATLAHREIQRVVHMMRMMYHVQGSHAQYCYDCDDWKVGRHPSILRSPCDDHRRITIECAVRYDQEEVLKILRDGKDRCAMRYGGDSFHIYMADDYFATNKHHAAIEVYHVEDEESLLNALDILTDLMPELEFECPEPRNKMILVNSRNKQQ